MDPRLRSHIMSQLGRAGGKAGTGAAKVRGDSEYYSRIGKLAAKKRWGKSNGDGPPSEPESTPSSSQSESS